MTKEEQAWEAVELTDEYRVVVEAEALYLHDKAWKMPLMTAREQLHETPEFLKWAAEIQDDL